MKQLLSKIFYDNTFLKNYYNRKFNVMYNRIITNYQKGGGYNVMYMNSNIKFNKIIDEDRLIIYLSTINKDDNCIMIIIDKDSKTAYIEGITNNKYNNCFTTPELNNGKVIMEITIKMLKKYQNKLNINNIMLKDNSFIQCSDKVKIWLANLSFLQYNDTFYGRFGFRPLDDDINTKYFENQEILKKSIVKSIDIENIIKKYKNNLNDLLKDKIIKNYNKYNDCNIVDWFNKFSPKYMNSDCIFFNHILDSIYKDLRLNSLKGETFVLKLK